MAEASRSLEKVQDKSSESYKLSKGLYLRLEGETYYRNHDYTKSLESLKISLKFTEELLEAHTDLARCYNAIGNCLYHLGKPIKALEFYNRAYKMQEQLSGSEYHFDMPMYKNQIGTVYESQGEYDKAVKYYRDALRLLKELKLSGFYDEAHFQRNLSNALMFQKKCREAAYSVIQFNTGSIEPPEIQARGPRAQAAYQEALQKGSVQVYRGRIMLLGQERAGKTSLKKSLLGIPFDPREESTVGVEVDPSKCEVEVDQVKNWQLIEQKKLDVSELKEAVAKMIAKDLKESKDEDQNIIDDMDLEQVTNRFLVRMWETTHSKSDR